jgi:hypothetical protein
MNVEVRETVEKKMKDVKDGLKMLAKLKVNHASVIVEYCPNLQYLEVTAKEKDELSVEIIKQTLKDGLKRLAKFKVDDVSVRSYPFSTICPLERFY